MTGHTTFAQRLVLENEWTSLRGMTLEAGFVLAQQANAATLERLGETGPAPLYGRADMRIMTIGTTYLAFQHRMVVRQLELCAHFQVTLKTGLRRFARIDDRLGRSPALDMQTSRSVTRFATNVLRVVSLRLQTSVRCSGEITGDRLVTGRTRLGTDELRPGNAGWGENGTVRFEVAARKQDDGESGSSPDAPEKLFALTAEPSS